MMPTVRNVAAVVVVTAIAMTGLASAQTPAGAAAQTQAPGPGAGAQRSGAPQTLTPAEAVNRVQQVYDAEVLARAQTALQLTDAQYQAFFVKMLELQRLRNQHQNNHAKLIRELNLATRPGATVDEAALQAKVKELDDLETQMATDERTAIAGIDSVLTPFQRARFRVMEENLEREKLRLLAKVLASPVASPAPGPGRGPGGR